MWNQLGNIIGSIIVLAVISLFVTKQGVALVGAGFGGLSNLVKAAKN